ncbi:hypothetical protein GN958_ATG04293 [Phytophthora infestans]|uniref:Ubiquitin-like protease family profile domain-containing protein n=1 Tax=Phytophthora infestans TaxID=4787 RepID=A0A8S9V0M3_PHYIN|nr:hypothetical protein GN958_ATG04293 [Phytophthora infestans]
MSDDSEGSCGGEAPLERRACLLGLRAQRREIERTARRTKAKTLEPCNAATQLATFELFHASISQTGVTDFVRKKREPYAARHGSGEAVHLILTSMHSLAVKYGNTGVTFKPEPADSLIPSKAKNNYKRLEHTIKEVVEPLLPMNVELNYCKITSCLQEDIDYCGLGCLIILELTLARTPWQKGLYKLVPYLRLRFLGMCTNYIDQKRDGR